MFRTIRVDEEVSRLLREAAESSGMSEGEVLRAALKKRAGATKRKSTERAGKKEGGKKAAEKRGAGGKAAVDAIVGSVSADWPTARDVQAVTRNEMASKAGRRTKRAMTLAERMAPFVGCISTGDPDAAHQSGRLAAAYSVAKHIKPLPRKRA